MKINLFGEERQIANDPQVMERVFEEITDLLKQTEDHLLMIVDGVEVTENHRAYVLSHLSEIEEMKVWTVSFYVIASESLTLMGQYLERAIPALRELTQEFYANPSAVSWAELEQLFEGIQWINEVAEGLERRKQEAFVPVIESIHSFSPVISDLERALEEKDYTLIADVLNYDISQQLISLKHEIHKFLNNEVAAHDVI